MENELIVRFNYIKNISLAERDRPKKYIMNKDNRNRMELMNKVLTKFTNYHPIQNITELNALHYAAAVTLTGVKEPSSTNTKHTFDPDRFIDEDIKKMRRWIG